MTAFEFRTYGLACDAPRCRQEFRGATGQSRAALRKQAGKAGWTHGRTDMGRRWDKDYCPEHKPEEG